jgi:hypothetical protein
LFSPLLAVATDFLALRIGFYVQNCYWWKFGSLSGFFCVIRTDISSVFMLFCKESDLERKLSDLILQLIFWFVLTETDEHGNCTACTVLELRLYDSAWMRTNQEKIKNKIKKR